MNRESVCTAPESLSVWEANRPLTFTHAHTHKQDVLFRVITPLSAPIAHGECLRSLQKVKFD